MKQTIRLCLFIQLLVPGFPTTVLAQTYAVGIDSLDLFDSARVRLVPVTVYLPKTNAAEKQQQLVIISHGYHANQPGSSKAYSYLGKALAGKGYFVASIQHELPTDELMPSAGIPQVVRKPFWERGVANILFVLNELKKAHSSLAKQPVILIGHSNGGDMSMLFAQQYPQLLDKVITLDNRRVAIPRTNQPRIYSLRSSDQPADEGVLPSPEEQLKYGIRILQLKNTLHNDMGDNGTAQQHSEINRYISLFLMER